MRDDLLDAQACVDWAAAHIKPLADRIESWVESNVDVAVENPDPNGSHNVIVAIEKSPLPRDFNVEVGAYINTIRSSLDLLATALAKRYGIGKPDDAYFPVARCAASFAKGKYRGTELVESLPPGERAAIESLKPYRGGNRFLWALHQLDIMRKHQRLLSVILDPMTFIIDGPNVESVFTPVATGFMRADNKSQRRVVLGLLSKIAAPQKYQMQFTPYVAFSEAELIGRDSVIDSLENFARLADTIICLFDN